MTMTQYRKVFLVGVALVLAASAPVVLAQEQDLAAPPAHLSDQQGAEASSLLQMINQQMGHPVLQRRDSRYVLQPGDQIEIDFPLAPAFNQVETVQPDGFISLSNLGDLHAAGKTVPELTEELKSKYTKIMRNPTITVVLKDFEHPYFVASGAVAKPGKYDLRGATTVAQAIAIAGGFGQFAKRSRVLLFRRVSDNYVEVKQLDYKEMLNRGKLQEDVTLQPGDLLFVPKSVSAAVLNALIPHTSVGLYLPMRPY